MTRHKNNIFRIFKNMQTGAFTLIELLVVISVISLLVSIILPSLNKARVLAKKAVCQGSLKGYQFASEMYAADNDDVLMDSYSHLDPDRGVPKYWGSKGILPENIARCCADQTTESLGRLGRFSQYGNLAVSIGCNENTMSASARMTSMGPMAFWIKRNALRGIPSQMMTWADWQDNLPDTDTTKGIAAVVKPDDSGMGTLCFRHDGASNAAFLDGHVGDMRPTIELTNDGHDLANTDWPKPSGVTSIKQSFKCFYPFGPASGFESRCKGDWPTVVYR